MPFGDVGAELLDLFGRQAETLDRGAGLGVPQGGIDLGEAGVAVGVGWGFDDVGDLPGPADLVDWLAVDGGAEQQSAGKRDGVEPVEEFGEQDVAGGAGDGLGEGAVDVTGEPAQPVVGPVDALGVQRGLQPVADVVEAGLAAFIMSRSYPLVNPNPPS